jgi:hypothetical protein
MKQTEIRPEFVSLAPDVLEPGIAYVSMEYSTVLHLCCCGCGNQVVTPLAPARFHLTFDGETISLNHSVGNWSFPCQSHYWIRRNQVLWDRPFGREEVATVRARDQRAIEEHSKSREMLRKPSVVAGPSWFERVKRWFRV